MIGPATMNLPLLLAGWLAAGLPVEATSLTGGDVRGQLIELNAQELKLQPESGPVGKASRRQPISTCG